MYLVRVTQLEQFRKWMTGCFYVNEQSVIDSLSGDFQGNNKTRIGTAGHKVIEEGLPAIYTGIGDNHLISVDDEYASLYSFHNIQKLCFHRENNLVHAYHEQKNGKDYETKHYKIHVGGTQDVIHGITIRDTKFVFRNPDYSNYTESCQWKFYLEFLGLDLFYFDLFEFVGYNDAMKLNVSTLELKQHEPIQCVRYKNMELDNQQLLNEFVDWIEFRGLRHLLKQKEEYYK